MQQINLYNFLPQPIRSSISFKILVILYAVPLIFFGILYAYGVHAKEQEESKYQIVSAKLVEVQKHLDAAKLKYANPLGAGITGSKCQVRFSLFMEALAKAAPPGVWLTQINISQSGNKMDLRGHALLSGQVQQFLDNLKQQKVFAKHIFELQELSELHAVSLQPEQPATSYFNFSVSSKVAS